MYIVNELRLRQLVDLRGRPQSVERPGVPLQAGEHDRRLRCRNPDTRSTASATGPGIAGQWAPVIAGTGLATRIIAERCKLGESISDLAQDYERPSTEIEEAIRCELEAAA